jgi:hypothetical protein
MDGTSHQIQKVGIPTGEEGSVEGSGTMIAIDLFEFQRILKNTVVIKQKENGGG